MISYYLRREVRERIYIVRDLAISDDRDWETITTISTGLEVMFAVTGTNAVTDEPELLFVSNMCWPLIGYWPNELVGRHPAYLHHRDPDMWAANTFIEKMIETGSAETKLASTRKNGDAYGCHVVGCTSPESRSSNKPEYYTFFSECPVSDCDMTNLTAVSEQNKNIRL